MIVGNPGRRASRLPWAIIFRAVGAPFRLLVLPSDCWRSFRLLALPFDCWRSLSTVGAPFRLLVLPFRLLRQNSSSALRQWNVDVMVLLTQRQADRDAAVPARDVSADYHFKGC